MQKSSYSAKYYLVASLVCGVAILFYLYEFTLRTIPSAITHELMRDLHLSAVGLGVLSSMFYYGYTIMQIPVGLLFNRFGTKLLLTSATALCAVGALFFGLANNIYVASFAYLLIGFASSFGFIGSLVLIARWFPAKHFAMLVGLTQLLGCLGAILGEKPIVSVVSQIGWHHMVYWCVAIGFVITLMAFIFIRNHPTENGATDFKKPLKIISQKQSLKIVAGNKQTWWIALYAFSIWAPVVVLGGLWGIPFLVTLCHVSTGVAAIGISIFWIGIALGGPVIGWWSNQMGRRCLPATLCSILAVIGGLVVIYAHDLSWPMLCSFLFLFGVSASGQALSFGFVQDINPPAIVGTAVGFNNMAVIIGGIFLQPIIGFLLKHNWDGGMFEGVAMYSISDYRMALLCVPICGFIGLYVSLFRLKETACRSLYISPDNELSKNNQVSMAH